MTIEEKAKEIATYADGSINRYEEQGALEMAKYMQEQDAVSISPTLYVKERATGNVYPVWKYSGTQGFDANWVSVYKGKEPKILVIGEQDVLFDGETIPCCAWCIPATEPPTE